MPLVTVGMLSGRTPEQRKAMVTGVTDAIVATLGVPATDVRIYVHEYATDDIAIGGTLVSEAWGDGS